MRARNLHMVVVVVVVARSEGALRRMDMMRELRDFGGECR